MRDGRYEQSIKGRLTRAKQAAAVRGGPMENLPLSSDITDPLMDGDEALTLLQVMHYRIYIYSAFLFSNYTECFECALVFSFKRIGAISLLSARLINPLRPDPDGILAQNVAQRSNLPKKKKIWSFFDPVA
jgi:hypothetical protein